MSANSSDPAAIQLKRKKSKVRSAWISFIGRIVAQIIGAVASVLLGLLVLTKYGLPDHLSKSAAAANAMPASASAERKVARSTSETALAVLPMQNYSKDAAHAYLADGVTEALTTELSQIPGLRVTSRTSSMAYRGTTKSLPQIARELDVDFILEGSVVRDHDTVRVTAQLIDAGSDRHVWARSYDRPIRNLLPAQAEITRQIKEDVKTALIRRIAPAQP
jgi:TolB-like protein